MRAQTVHKQGLAGHGTPSCTHEGLFAMTVVAYCDKPPIAIPQ